MILAEANNMFYGPTTAYPVLAPYLKFKRTTARTPSSCTFSRDLRNKSIRPSFSKGTYVYDQNMDHDGGELSDPLSKFRYVGDSQYPLGNHKGYRKWS